MVWKGFPAFPAHLRRRPVSRGIQPVLAGFSQYQSKGFGPPTLQSVLIHCVVAPAETVQFKACTSVMQSGPWGVGLE